ncbi:MAG: helix-turn-helix transcriptional regulator [Christensenellaceae bacterium]
MEKFGERLKALRLEKGLGQVQLAKELNVSKSVISLWETGGSEPTLNNLVKIAAYFNVSIDYLAGIE